MSGTAAELAHLFRALKAPAAARALPALADRAREEGWSYERFAELLLWAPRSTPATVTAARAASRPPGSRPARRWRSLTSPSNASVKKTVIEHLGQLDFLHAKENVILLGPPDPVSHCPLRDGHGANSPASD